jgi:excisionase family DNA binding protein
MTRTTRTIGDPITPEDFGIPKRRSYTIRELARHLSVSDSTIRRMIKRRRLRGVRVGSSIKIPWAEIVRYFEREQTNVDPEIP